MKILAKIENLYHPREPSARQHAGEQGRQDGCKRVMRIITRLNVGGPARHVTWLTRGTKDAGYDTVLVTGTVPAGEDNMSHFASQQGVKAIALASLSHKVSWKDAIAIWKLYRMFRRFKPDIVHTHTSKAGTVGRIAGLLYRWLTPAALIGRPRRCHFVHTFHGHIFHNYYNPLKTWIFLTVEKLLARLATNRMIALCPQQYREIHKTFGIGRAEQFAVIPLGLDLNIFKDGRRRRDLLRNEMRAKQDEVLVGIVGRLTEIKNHKLFLRAASLLKKTHRVTDVKRVRFVIIGDGHLRRALEAQVDSLGLTGDVTFLGMRDDPENFYPALDIVALTSMNEGTPLTILEAMANSRAVIATAVGGVRDLLGAARDTNGQNCSYTLCQRGMTVVPNDPVAFSQGLEQLIHQKQVRTELGRRGRAFVEQNFSINRLIDDISNLYDELLKPRAKMKPLPAKLYSTSQHTTIKETKLCEY